MRRNDACERDVWVTGFPYVVPLPVLLKEVQGQTNHSWKFVFTTSVVFLNYCIRQVRPDMSCVRVCSCVTTNEEG